MENQTTPETPSPAPAPRRWPLHLHLKGVWLIILIVAIGLALIAYFGLKHNNNSVNNNSSAAKQAAISITPAGFSPAEISVKVGSQVTWTNTDKAAHEVAADPYPKNNSIPGFNNTVLLQTGDSYSFTFSQSGTYHVHDQLHPLTLLGTVVVK